MSAIMYRDRIYGLGGAGGGGGGTAAQELTAAEYAELTQAEKENGTIYFVKGKSDGYTYVNNVHGTTYGYFDVSGNATKIAAVVMLNNVIYAGFVFDTETKQSVVMDSVTLQSIATSLGKQLILATTTTLTQSETTPSLYWAYSANHDNLYLDMTNFYTSQSVGTKCGYSGCYSYLYESQDMSNKVYFMDTLYAEHD